MPDQGKSTGEARYEPLGPGLPLGIAVSGSLLLLIGAAFDQLALSDFHINVFDGLHTFLPGVAAALTCADIAVRRRSSSRWALAILSAVGLLYMLLQWPWGEILLHGGDGRALAFARYTYVGDSLFALGFSFGLIGSIGMMMVSSRATREQRRT